MKIFQNKFFIVCLCVAVAVAGISSTLSIMGYNGLLRNALGVIATPFRLVGTAFVNAWEGFTVYFGSIGELTEQNQQLKDQNAALQEQLERAERLEQENQRLRAYLAMKAEYPSLSFEEGMVIGREASNHVTVLTLNRGTVHGIETNMAVITKEGIVGCVSEVGLTWCKVSTLLETARSVGVYLPRNNAAGILSGDYSMKNDGLCKLTFVDMDAKNADVQPGDTVYSSGLGSVYPPDLKVGEVVSVEVDNASRTLIALVRPAVDFSEPDYFMIITGYQK
ncbi:MAG: rod shape-determining protein MreC [Ruminococcaceae bacterium]|nr:rod shape-determining protein MreC [Oscillospiraceae bacterium]